MEQDNMRVLAERTMSSMDQNENCLTNGDKRSDGKGNQKRPFVVSIEGNIGSGKSTMINYFKNFEDIQIHPEPVEKWQNINGQNLLEKLYADPKRWSFQFQSYIQLTRLQELKAPMKEGKTVRLLERSIQSNKYCFLELAKDKKDLCNEESAVLEQWYDWLDEHISLELDLIVYLRTKPQIAYERMLKRGREEETGENGPPLAYLEILHAAYEDWLMHQKFGPLKEKIIVLDANQDLGQMKIHYEEYQDQMRGLNKNCLDLCVKPVTPLTGCKKLSNK